MEQSLTNDAADLVALYPGLIVTGTSNFFVNEVTTNVTAFFTNYPYSPVDAAPSLAFRTNLTTNVVTRYIHTYDNVLTNTVFTNCYEGLLTTNIAPAPYAPVGTIIQETNVTLETFVRSNCISGSFFILPSNVCDYQIISTQLTQVVTTTNLLTNTFTSFFQVSTNAGGGSNVAVRYFEFSQSEVTYFTNEILTAYPVFCNEEITSLFEGIQKVRWERRDYDSLLGQFFVPVTNEFSMTEITNFNRVTRYIDRAIEQPDILFTADDIVTGPEEWPILNFTISRQVPNYVTPTNINVLGPGTIQPTAAFTFNKVGPLFFNIGPAFVDEASATLDYIWGSFDGTTNDPIVYPDGTDLNSLEYLTVFQVTNPTTLTNGVFVLPDGAVGAPYNGAGFQLMASGGLTPYTWALDSQSSAQLPDGISLSTDGWLTGTPTTPGIYDFFIRLTDDAARSITYPFTLTVNP